MIHVINIVTPTQDDDDYKVVAVNEFPIVYIDEEGAEDILDDIELINIIKEKIKNSTTYNNATINIRSIDDDYCVKDTSFKLSDKITSL